MGMHDINLNKLKRQLRICEEITYYNFDHICAKYSISKSYARDLYYKSKRADKMANLRFVIEEKESSKNKISAKDINREIKRIILDFEEKQRDHSDICKLLNRNVKEIEVKPTYWP